MTFGRQKGDSISYGIFKEYDRHSEILELFRLFTHHAKNHQPI